MSACALPRLLLASGLMAAMAPVEATPFNTPGPFVQYQLDPQGQAVTFHTDQWVHVEATTAFGGQTGTSVIDGQGGVGVGRIRLAEAGAGYSTFAWAGWNEQLTFTPANPALNGQTVMVDFRLAYNWSVSLSDPAPTTLDAEVYIDMSLLRPAPGLPNRYANIGEQVLRSCAQPGDCGNPVSFATTGVALPVANGQVATFSFPVTLGLTYPVVFGMNASVQGKGGTLTIDATHTMTWASRWR